MLAGHASFRGAGPTVAGVMLAAWRGSPAGSLAAPAAEGSSA